MDPSDSDHFILLLVTSFAPCASDSNAAVRMLKGNEEDALSGGVRRRRGGVQDTRYPIVHIGGVVAAQCVCFN